MPNKSDLERRKSQMRVLESFVPHGISCCRFDIGTNDWDARNKKDCYARLRAAGYISKQAVNNKGEGRKKNRDILTGDGMGVILKHVIPDELAVYVKTGAVRSVKNGYSISDFRKETNRADVTVFLNAVGVEDAFQVVAKHWENPFIFGYPRTRSDSATGNPINFYETTLNAAIEFAKHNDLLSVLDGGDVNAFFLLNSQNAVIQSSIERENKEAADRFFSNSLGVLIDLSNRCAYVVLKVSNRKKLLWMKRGYTKIQIIYSDVLKKIGVINTLPGTAYMDTALFFCETEGEICEKARLCAESDVVPKPFLHVLPILMKRDGADILEKILSDGLQNYIEAENEFAYSYVSGIKRKEMASGSIYFTEGNEVVYNGTIVDYALVNRIRNEQDLGRKFKLICKERQLLLYTKYAGIEQDRLLVIPE